MANLESTFILTSSQRKESQERYWIFQLLNGPMVSFLGIEMITLLILACGGGGFAIAFAASALYFSTILNLFMPAFLSGLDYIRSVYVFWILRGLTCFFYFVIIYLYHYFWGPEDSQITVFLICAVYFIFCMFRAVGTLSFLPIINAITTQKDRGRFTSILWRNGNFGNLIALAVSYLILRYSPLENKAFTLLCLVFLGIITNTTASLIIRKMPSIGSIPKVQFIDVFSEIGKVFRNRELALLMIIRFFTIGMAITLGMVTAFLKEVCRLENSTVFLMILILAIGKICGASFSRRVTDIVGSRPILFFIHVVIACLAIALYVYPQTHPLTYLGLLVFFIGFSLTQADIQVINLVLSFAPKGDLLKFSAVNNLVTSLSAMILGTLTGFLISTGANVDDSFQKVWICLFVFAIGILFVLFFLKKGKDMPINRILEIFTSLQNIRGLFTVNAMHEEENPDRKSLYLSEVVTIDQPYARREILRALTSSNMLIKRKAFDAIKINPFPEAYEIIMKEAKREDAFTREAAIHDLRYYPCEESEKFLRKICKGRDSFALQSVLSLCHQIKGQDPDLKNVILEWLTEEKVPQTRSRLIYALSRIDLSFVPVEIALKESERKTSREYIRFLYIAVAGPLGWNKTLEIAFSLEDEISGAGYMEILNILEDFEPYREKRNWLMNAPSHEISEWLKKEVDDLKAMNINLYTLKPTHDKTLMFFLLVFYFHLKEERSAQNHKS